MAKEKIQFVSETKKEMSRKIKYKNIEETWRLMEIKNKKKNKKKKINKIVLLKLQILCIVLKLF